MMTEAWLAEDALKSGSTSTWGARCLRMLPKMWRLDPLEEDEEERVSCSKEMPAIVNFCIGKKMYCLTFKLLTWFSSFKKQ